MRQHPYSGTILVLATFNRISEKPLRDIPLKQMKQIVKAAARKQATLDEIYNEINEWYNEPVILPAICLSDHQGVSIFPIVA